MQAITAVLKNLEQDVLVLTWLRSTWLYKLASHMSGPQLQSEPFQQVGASGSSSRGPEREEDEKQSLAGTGPR